MPKIRRYLAGKPAKTWNVGNRTAEDGTHCALGHLEALTGGMIWSHDSLLDPFTRLVRPDTEYSSPGWALAYVNNGLDPRYKQPTPRARVLQAIDDLIAGTIPAAPV